MNADIFAPKWYVVYTMPNAERKVASKISEMGFEAYLPLHTVVRQWSDRRKKLQLPLFPNYVFVKLSEKEHWAILSIKQLVSFVSLEKKPVVIREDEINTIKRILNEDFQVTPDEYFQEGRRIRILHGQFAGVEGIIFKKGGNSRLLIRLDGLVKAFSFNISSKFAEVLGEVY